MRKARHEGGTAYWMDHPLSANPYDIEKQPNEFGCWKQGWNQSEFEVLHPDHIKCAGDQKEKP